MSWLELNVAIVSTISGPSPQCRPAEADYHRNVSKLVSCSTECCLMLSGICSICWRNRQRLPGIIAITMLH